MDATIVLVRLADLGINATVDGVTLVLTPGRKVPNDPVSDVRVHKSETCSACVSRTRSIPGNGT